jgi:transcriptional regulator with GAF, ATPase, and Fis domain
MSEENIVEQRQALDSRGAPLAAGVSRNLSELARQMQAQPSTQAVMDRIVAAAVLEIEQASGAVITLLERGERHSPAYSDNRARLVGLAQQHTSEGPCVQTSREQVTVRCDDLRTEARWPRWAAEAIAHGVLSVMSFQLFAGTDSMGALEVYSDSPNAFDEEAENTGLLLAAHAAMALSASRKISNLNVALATRDLIGQAKGILMERYKIDAVHAFDLLVSASQMTHLKLKDIAEQLATTGELPAHNRK